MQWAQLRDVPTWSAITKIVRKRKGVVLWKSKDLKLYTIEILAVQRIKCHSIFCRPYSYFFSSFFLLDNVGVADVLAVFIR